MAKSANIKLNQAQQQHAIKTGFRHYHELQTVANKCPHDPRLMKTALGTTDLNEVIFDNQIYLELDSLVEDQMSGAISETNALGYMIDVLEPYATEYDSTTGVLTIKANLTYIGEQDLDRVFSGSQFYLQVEIRLFRNVDQWVLDNEDPLIITSSKSDQELDWEAQAAGYLY